VRNVFFAFMAAMMPPPAQVNKLPYFYQILIA